MSSPTTKPEDTGLLTGTQRSRDTGASGELATLVTPNSWRRFVETFQRLMDSLKSNREPAPAHLASLAGVGSIAGTTFSCDDPHHISALEALWRVFHGGDDVPAEPAPSAAHPLLFQEGWKTFGFQNANPTSDFRGVGILGARNLIYFANSYPNAFYRCLYGRNSNGTYSAVGGDRSSARVAPEPAPADVPPPGVPASKVAVWRAAAHLRAATGYERYTFAIAGLNVTMLLLGMLDLPGSQAAGHRSCLRHVFQHTSPTSEVARQRLVAMLAQEVESTVQLGGADQDAELRAAERAFGDVFSVAMRVLDELWDAGSCDYSLSLFNAQLLPLVRARLEVIFRNASSIPQMTRALLTTYGV